MIRRVAFLLIVALGGPALAAELKPNFVVFLSDDHGLLDSTPYGATDVRTPNMQRLAAGGMLFTHAFIASPACAPSRTALLTGLMPARNGAEANHTFKREGIRSLPEILAGLGYDVAAFGKVAHGADVTRHGFTHHDNRYATRVVEEYLNTRDVTKPLCLFVGTRDPHVPWAPNQGYDPAKLQLPPTFVDTPETREFRARYYTDVTTADRELGEVLDLSRRQLGTNLLFLYTSDHGAQWPFGKWNLYDAGIRSPLLAAWPGVIQPGTRSEALVQWIDLLPTLIELAGGTAPRDIDGRSFAEVLRGRRTAHRDAIFTTHSGDGRMNVYPIRALRTRDWKYILNLHPDFAHTTHIDQGAGAGDGWRYFREWAWASRTNSGAAAVVKRYHERPREELYDLCADPHEQRNLATESAQAARLAEMRTRLETWMKAQGDLQTVFNQPRLLSEPASYAPVTNPPPAAAPASEKKNKPSPPAFSGDSARPVDVRRLPGNPIIRPELLPGRDGANINGPSLIRAPTWLTHRLGTYYLYFAHHNGKHIRLAYADRLEGPWKTHAPGALQLSNAPGCTGHIASPDVHVDEARREVRMYFHGPAKRGGGQKSFIAVSKDGRRFQASDEPLGLFYFRVFQHDGWWYALAKGGVLYRSKDGLGNFERGHNPFPGGELRKGDLNEPGPRHVALHRVGDVLWIYYSSIGDAPERILRARLVLTPDWREWKAVNPVEILRPEHDWEGADLPVKPSQAGAMKGREHALRDPAIFVDADGPVYLLYSVAGEAGLAIAELKPVH